MKKNYMLLVILFFTSFFAQAQTFPYFFSVETEANYTPLTDSISLNNGEVWDDPDYVIPLGFEFDFYEFGTDTFYISNFGLGGLLTPANIEEEPVQPLLITYGSDIIDVGYGNNISGSEISYKIEGLAGSRIVKVEWKNVGFYNELEVMGTVNNYLSFQLWLYEQNGDIEIHFGPNSIVDDGLVHDDMGPLVGIVNGYSYLTDEFSEFWFLTGDEQNPTLDTLFSFNDPQDNLMGLDDDPSAGTIYRFSTAAPVSTSNPAVDHKVSIYPTTTNDLLNIKLSDIDLEDANLVIFDATGRLMLKRSLQDNFTSLNIQNLVPGMYFVNVNTIEGMTTKKIIKQ